VSGRKVPALLTLLRDHVAQSITFDYYAIPLVKDFSMARQGRDQNRFTSHHTVNKVRRMGPMWMPIFGFLPKWGNFPSLEYDFLRPAVPIAGQGAICLEMPVDNRPPKLVNSHFSPDGRWRRSSVG
jgi:hypothetical protein